MVNGEDGDQAEYGANSESSGLPDFAQDESEVSQ